MWCSEDKKVVAKFERSEEECVWTMGSLHNHGRIHKYMQLFSLGYQLAITVTVGVAHGINFRYSYSRGGGTERP